MTTTFPPLALDGGPRALPEGPPAWPREDSAVLAAIESAAADGSWGRYHGPHEERLLAALTERHGVPHALLCCSGTFAVELALRGLNIGPDDEVILAGYDFPGNFRAIEAIGAIPVLADIRADNWTLDVAAVAAAHGPRTRAVLVSHLHGGLADMAALRAWADRQGVAIVEDACQSPGASVSQRPAGTLGDVGVLSFGGSKLLTAGRGGAILTRSADVCQRAKIYCQRGNNAFPLSELQAAVLLPQVGQLDAFNKQRRIAVELLRKALGQLKAIRALIKPEGPDLPSYYKLGFHYDAAELNGCPIERFVAAAQAEGLALDRGFRGFSLRSGRRCRRADDLLNSRHAADATLLLHHPVLLEAKETIVRVAEALLKVAHWLSR